MAPRLPTARTSASGDVREMLGRLETHWTGFNRCSDTELSESTRLQRRTICVNGPEIKHPSGKISVHTSKPIPKTSRGTLRESVKFSVERRPPQLSKDCSHTIRST
ncbi:hypothetical protein KEM48_001164 [Puccinia striiformis f. sp. tritici PST-130]|nr:hypothetical protein KEM48_001164 [Puccinia striiformis f. sp. tritici PST-130]